MSMDGDGNGQQQHYHRRKLDGILTYTCRICLAPMVDNYCTRVDINGDAEDNIPDKKGTDAGILLFSEESKRLQLLRKIRKYLYLTISLEDKLPKVMCKMCVKNLEAFHMFALLAVKTQEKLNSLLNEESKSVQMNSDEPRGLLHTYLTKGVIDIPKDESSSTEEMEVRLDPMLFLQYSSADQTCEDTVRVESVNGYYDNKDDLEIFKGKNLEGMDLPRKSPTLQFKTRENMGVIIDERKYVRNNLSSEDLSMEQNDSASTTFQSALYKAVTSRPVYNCNQCSITFPNAFALQSHNWHHITQSLTNNNLKNDCQPESLSQSEPDTDDGSSEDGSLQDRDRPLNLIARSYQLPFMPTANSIQTMLLSALNRGLERFCCPICGKKISTKGNLKVHLDTHRPKGKYGCDICGRIFKTQCNLLRHKEYHQGVQFPCIVCGRVYPTNSTLRAHSITHSDLRPHKCPLCDKTFKRNQDLKFHINQHTGARPYQCPYCPKAFASSGNCFSHRKRMHPEEVERDKERAAKIMS